MVLKRKWSITLVGMFSITLLAMLLMLVGGASVQAASGQSVPRVFYDGDCGPPYLTDPYCFAGNAHPIIWDAHAEGNPDGRASGHGDLQYKDSSFVLTFGRVEQVLFDADQIPTGAVFSAQVTVSEGDVLDELADGGYYVNVDTTADGCCAVEIHAPESGRGSAIRFQAPGTLRFE